MLTLKSQISNLKSQKAKHKEISNSNIRLTKLVDWILSFGILTISCLSNSVFQTNPWSNIASATLRKAAMFAPLT